MPAVALRVLACIVAALSPFAASAKWQHAQTCQPVQQNIVVVEYGPPDKRCCTGNSCPPNNATIYIVNRSASRVSAATVCRTIRGESKGQGPTINTVTLQPHQRSWFGCRRVFEDENLIWPESGYEMDVWIGNVSP
jgi:hypothetical protein